MKITECLTPHFRRGFAISSIVLMACAADPSDAQQAATRQPDMSTIQQSETSPLVVVILETEPFGPIGRTRITPNYAYIGLSRRDGPLATTAKLYPMTFGQAGARHNAMIGQFEPGRYSLDVARIRAGDREDDIPLCNQIMFEARAGEVLYLGHYQLVRGFMALPDNFNLAAADIKSLSGVSVPTTRATISNPFDTMTIEELVRAKC